MSTEATIDLTAVDAIRRDPALWFNLFGTIRDESTRELFVPNKVNVLQRRAFAAYKHRAEQKTPCRLVLVKPRGRGGSTTMAALVYHHTINYPSWIGIIGTQEQVSLNALEIIETMAQNDKFVWAPTETKHTSKRIEWAHGSRLEVYTAEQPESARSARLQGYWATESSRWPAGGATDAYETLISMRGALPKRGWHFVGEESTPRGASGAFFETFHGGCWPAETDWWHLFEPDLPQNIRPEAGECQFIRIFAAWFEFDDSVRRISASEAQKVQDSLDEEEQRLINRFGNEGPRGLRLGKEVDTTVWEQLAWRRMMIAGEFAGNARTFTQEHPSDPAGCWLASGAPVFDPDAMLRIELTDVRPPQTGVLVKNTARNTVSFIQEPDGWCQIWAHPYPDHRFIIGADPASGKSQTESAGADAHSFLVVRDAIQVQGKANIDPAAIVARITPPCMVPPESYGHMVELLSLYYGLCLVAPEVNNTGGGALIEQLRKRNIPFFHREKINPNSGSITKFEGWLTTDQSRRVIISKLQWAILRSEIQIPCAHVLSELKTFIRKPNGREEHADGRHDDDCLALAIALQCLPEATPFKVDIATTKRYQGWQGDQREKVVSAHRW